LFVGFYPNGHGDDTDGDGIPNSTDPDDDNDGIIDTQDLKPLDTDNDGLNNDVDTDDDNDGKPDTAEQGTKGQDGKYTLPDSDNRHSPAGLICFVFLPFCKILFGN